MAISIRHLGISEFEQMPNLASIVAEYAKESAVKELGMVDPQFDMYEQLESAGMFHMFGAFQGGVLIGFLALLLTVAPHFGKLVASTEAFFVAKAVRKTGAGLKLLRYAEGHARDIGAVALCVSAPTGGRLARVLPGIGYRETNRVYFRNLLGGNYGTFS